MLRTQSTQHAYRMIRTQQIRDITAQNYHRTRGIFRT